MIENTARKVLIEPHSRRIPETVHQLQIWQYHERSIHRILCGWGRQIREWDDASNLHRHIWEQTEIIRRLRERICQFPGGKPDAPVHRIHQEIADTFLLAPSFEDALDGVYLLLNQALTRAYRTYCASVHPVHDAPTITALEEIIRIKESHSSWYGNYRRSNPHKTDPAHLLSVTDALKDLEASTGQRAPLKEDSTAGSVGVASGFRLASRPGHPPGWRARYEIFPYIRCDFSSDVEARRLFWAIAYMREKNLAVEMLRWLFDGHHMPWVWVADVSRHMWDESRHGDSGMARLRDWDIALDEVGMVAHGAGLETENPPPDEPPLTWARALTILSDAPPLSSTDEPLDAMSPLDLYEATFFICMIAEQGHFVVKNEAYDDFRGGEDLESAEMMLFDIIDETTHVQYGHKWLPELARHAGVDNADYRARAAAERVRRQEVEISGTKRCQDYLPRTPGFAPWDHYQNLLERVRAKTPLTNTKTCAKRSPKPM